MAAVETFLVNKIRIFTQNAPLTMSKHALVLYLLTGTLTGSGFEYNPYGSSAQPGCCIPWNALPMPYLVKAWLRSRHSKWTSFGNSPAKKCTIDDEQTCLGLLPSLVRTRQWFWVSSMVSCRFYCVLFSSSWICSEKGAWDRYPSHAWLWHILTVKDVSVWWFIVFWYKTNY